MRTLLFHQTASPLIGTSLAQLALLLCTRAEKSPAADTRPSVAKTIWLTQILVIT